MSSLSSAVLIRARLLNREKSGFGISVSPRTVSPPTLMISGLAKDGEAESSGLIRPGDIILQINNRDVSRCSYEEALEVLRSAPLGETSRFVLRAPFGYTTHLSTYFAPDGSPRTFRITERAYTTNNQRPQAEPGKERNGSQTPGNGPATINLHLMDDTDAKKSTSAGGTDVGAGRCPISRRPIRLKNVSSSASSVDTLHQTSLETIGCTQKICSGSLMNWKHQSSGARKSRTADEVIHFARNFLDQYYASIKRLNSEAHEQRWTEVQSQITTTGTYQLKETELIFGAKLAWRNAPRCIGRIQWSKLQVFDFRFVSTAREMFEAICNHIKYATNKGNLRSAITVFPQRSEDPKNDFRVWNPQLISYAGYCDPSDPTIIVGDPANIEITQLCQKLGWKSKRTRWDILPLVLSAEGQDPQMFSLPDELVLRVPLKHPKYDWWEELRLEWYALPAVAGMLLDVGGLEFPAAPFSGWYMVTEIACRDLCDSNRYNILEDVAVRMGLDTRSNVTLWKDAASVEVHIAVLDSFQKAGVTIVDHHTAAESFMKHLENEQRLRGGCPADWVWVVPPTAGSLTPVFHQEMLYYEMKPSYEYQESPIKTHHWSKLPGSEQHTTPSRKIRFKEIARAVKFTSNLFGKALSKRIKATILFATETGKSEQYSKRLSHIFSHAFNVNVVCMDTYDTFHLEHEALLLIVTSTFGNGDPPENGETFARQLQAIKVTGDTTPDIESVRSISMSYLRISSIDSTDGVNMPPYEDTVSQVGPLSNIRFAVFALGSSAYPNFCAFGRFIDNMLAELGGERIAKVATGDELCGQEQAFGDWAKKVFEEACDVFCLGDEVNMTEVMKSATLKPLAFSTANVKLEPAQPTPNLAHGLSKGSNRKVVPLSIIDVTPLYEAEEDGKKTIMVQLKALEQDQETSSFTYLPGDHLGIFPENSALLIDGIAARLSEKNLDSVYQVMLKKPKSQEGGKEQDEWQAHEWLPNCSLRDALTRYLDINTPPTQQLLGLLAAFTDDEQEREKLALLASDPRKYEEWKAAHFPNLLELLQLFPRLQLPAELIYTQLPPMQPRFYSISSSPAYNHLCASPAPNISPKKALSLKSKSSSRPGTPTSPRRALSSKARTQPGTPTSPLTLPGADCSRVDLTVAIVRYTTQSGNTHFGVCSNFLAQARSGQRVFGFIRNAPNFRLPDKEDTPVIMVGPGTGIAPFRAFWLQRHASQIIHPRRFGQMSLFCGCRFQSMQLYKEETNRMVADGVLTQVFTAFSREKGLPKRYVQDYMMKASQEIYHQLIHQKGHFYVCGDVSMAEDVCKTLKRILRENGIDDPDAALISLRESMQIHEDIYGDIFRVTFQKQQQAAE